MKLTVLNDTVFKLSPVPSYQLETPQKVSVTAGTEFEVHSYDDAENQHLKVALLNASLGTEGKNTWYMFAPHIAIEGNEPENKPQDEADPNTTKISTKKEGPFQLPGYQSTFYLSEPIISGGHFSWAEATKNGTRIPVNKQVVEGILRVADVMEEVRDYLGAKPITINSWYRDPVTNRRIGGASRSRHLSGDAVDFVVAGIAPPDVNRRLESWWGGRGGLASASCFTHIDCRGYRARWSYGY